MLLLFLAAAAVTAHPPAERAVPPHVDNMHVIDPRGSNAANCPPMSRYEAARRGGKLKPNLLTELPGADMYNAVYRTVGGCVAPIIVRYDVGRR
jgi:hypothetical protein